MGRSNHRGARDTHHTVSAGILDALGRGFLIATAGVVAGAIIGTSHLAAMGLWTIGVTAAGGVACMVGSALVKNAACDRRERNVRRSPQATTGRKVVAAMPNREIGEGDSPEEGRARRRVMLGRQQNQDTGRSP